MVVMYRPIVALAMKTPSPIRVATTAAAAATTAVAAGPQIRHLATTARNLVRPVVYESTARWRLQVHAEHRTRRFNSSARHRTDSKRTENDRREGQDPGYNGQNLSFSARLKRMIREYGWAALGVYLGLSVLDFPLCFACVRIIGTDKIAAVEHWVASCIPAPVSDSWHKAMSLFRRTETKATGDDGVYEMAMWGVQEAEARNKTDASLATQLALAYAIHKAFIFVRVPLTAAVLPKVVKVLRSWGWQIGKKSK